MNYYDIEHPILVIIYFISSFLIISPFLCRVINNFQTSSLTSNDIFLSIQPRLDSLYEFLSTQLTSTVIMVSVTLYYSSIFFLGLSLTDKSNETDKTTVKIKRSLLQILCYLALILQIPLSNYLAYVFVNSLNGNAYLSALALLNFSLTCVLIFLLEQYSVSVRVGNSFVFSKIYIANDGLFAVLKLCVNNLFLYVLANEILYTLLFLILIFLININDLCTHFSIQTKLSSKRSTITKSRNASSALRFW